MKRHVIRWSDTETKLLLSLVSKSLKSNKHHINWYHIAREINTKFDNGRTVKSCRCKYFNINPDTFNNRWTPKEISTLQAYTIVGKKGYGKLTTTNRWSFISRWITDRFKRYRSPAACKQKFHTTSIPAREYLGDN